MEKVCTVIRVSNIMKTVEITAGTKVNSSWFRLDFHFFKERS